MLPAEQRASVVSTSIGKPGLPALSSAVLEDGTIGIADAIVHILEDVELVHHFANRMNGKASIWLLPEQQQVVLSWKGSQHARDWVQDGKIARHEWIPGDQRVHISGWQNHASGLGTRWSLGKMNFRDMNLGLPVPVPVPTFEDHDASCFMMHRGFLEQYGADAMGGAIQRRVGALLQEHPGFSLLITGHSLGGALAHLSAYELAAAHPETACLLITFGSPRPGNARFASALDNQPNVAAYRVQNGMDPVTRAPWFGYAHAGHHVWLKDGRIEVSRACGEGPPQAAQPYANIVVGATPSTKFDPGHHPLAGSCGYEPHLLHCSQREGGLLQYM